MVEHVDETVVDDTHRRIVDALIRDEADPLSVVGNADGIIHRQHIPDGQIADCSADRGQRITEEPADQMLVELPSVPEERLVSRGAETSGLSLHLLLELDETADAGKRLDERIEQIAHDVAKQAGDQRPQAGDPGPDMAPDRSEPVPEHPPDVFLLPFEGTPDDIQIPAQVAVQIIHETRKQDPLFPVVSGGSAVSETCCSTNRILHAFSLKMPEFSL